MLTIVQCVREYFKARLGFTQNKHGIRSSCYDGVSADCGLPGYGASRTEAFVTLTINSPSVPDFVADFSLRSPMDLYRVTRAWMYDRYRRGKAEICCTINDYRSCRLYFMLDGDKMYARDCGYNTHRVTFIARLPDRMIFIHQKTYAGLTRTQPDTPCALHPFILNTACLWWLKPWLLCRLL